MSSSTLETVVAVELDDDTKLDLLHGEHGGDEPALVIRTPTHRWRYNRRFLATWLGVKLGLAQRTTLPESPNYVVSAADAERIIESVRAAVAEPIRSAVQSIRDSRRRAELAPPPPPVVVIPMEEDEHGGLLSSFTYLAYAPILFPVSPTCTVKQG